MDFIQTQFTDRLKQKNIMLSDDQLSQFETYYKELVEWNEKMNLTGITEREQVYVKHFYDSLSVAFFVPMEEQRCLADIGSGAGFPSIPLKIVFPHLQVTIVDSLNKRIQFLNHLTERLNLSDVQCIHGRAEDIARTPEHRDHYDIVTARAVARLAVLNEFCLPFVKANGHFIAMKGSEVGEEVQEAAFSLKELKGTLVQTHSFELPDQEVSKRHLVIIRKTAATPAKYPRKAGTPLKSPLVR
ncbi:16S rRNA (guanine(527)-N(7))-methyltransferase RsmG [Paenibacillus doosanensis]|uniref:16S rRNA (guanine(527)-N(7))-methyltransferase RsmG n=1 Tax=Paenibacillus doosanensis TaxID=1229154 RepID=UPI0021800473|nr:16S rRNA (guanine(527)-N(7))-methyltransferase RsmG [Paenibacillus doosanensis]MCS7463110.1 16S rRNA (guanine(527)-N(7))-methyltransferase RsmG [Paenibacillus doosanensis]